MIMDQHQGDVENAELKKCFSYPEVSLSRKWSLSKSSNLSDRETELEDDMSNGDASKRVDYVETDDSFDNNEDNCITKNNYDTDYDSELNYLSVSNYNMTQKEHKAECVYTEFKQISMEYDEKVNNLDKNHPKNKTPITTLEKHSPKSKTGKTSAKSSNEKKKAEKITYNKKEISKAEIKKNLFIVKKPEVPKKINFIERNKIISNRSIKFKELNDPNMVLNGFLIRRHNIKKNPYKSNINLTKNKDPERERKSTYVTIAKAEKPDVRKPRVSEKKAEKSIEEKLLEESCATIEEEDEETADESIVDDLKNTTSSKEDAIYRKMNDILEELEVSDETIEDKNSEHATGAIELEEVGITQGDINVKDGISQNGIEIAENKNKEVENWSIRSNECKNFEEPIVQARSTSSMNPIASFIRSNEMIGLNAIIPSSIKCNELTNYLTSTVNMTSKNSRSDFSDCSTEATANELSKGVVGLIIHNNNKEFTITWKETESSCVEKDISNFSIIASTQTNSMATISNMASAPETTVTATTQTYPEEIWTSDSKNGWSPQQSTYSITKQLRQPIYAAAVNTTSSSNSSNSSKTILHKKHKKKTKRNNLYLQLLSHQTIRDLFLFLIYLATFSIIFGALRLAPPTCEFKTVF